VVFFIIIFIIIIIIYILLTISISTMYFCDQILSLQQP
jgi:hypothetical protein